MGWDKNPLLKEERDAEVTRSTLRSSYDWAVAEGVSILSWRGRVIGSAFGDGRYRLQWRDKLHEGQAASQAQAIRFMDRWIRARGMDAPFVDAKSKRSLVVPLGDFLRDYENGEIQPAGSIRSSSAGTGWQDAGSKPKGAAGPAPCSGIVKVRQPR